MPIMSQMTCSGSKPEASATKSASPSRWLAIMLVTIVPCPVSHAVLDAGHHLRRERSVDDCAEPQVTRVVQADHRACELRDLRRHLVEGRACRNRAEDLGVATGMVDVVEPGERPVAGARGETRELRYFEEGDRRLASQRRERSVAQVVVALPELERCRGRCHRAVRREEERRSRGARSLPDALSSS